LRYVKSWDQTCPKEAMELGLTLPSERGGPRCYALRPSKLVRRPSFLRRRGQNGVISTNVKKNPVNQLWREGGGGEGHLRRERALQPSYGAPAPAPAPAHAPAPTLHQRTQPPAGSWEGKKTWISAEACRRQEDWDISRSRGLEQCKEGWGGGGVV
jgi:hypothetical protein